MEYVKKPELFEMAAARFLKAITLDHRGDAVMFRSSMEPGRGVPFHSHIDPEAFYVLSGNLEVLIIDDAPRWHAVGAGTSVLLEDGVKHAVRNAGDEIADFIVITNRRLADFFQTAGTPVDEDAEPVKPSPETISKILRIAKEFGYWMASPAENEALMATAEENHLP